MKIHVVSVGRAKGPVAEAAELYRKRASRYFRLEVREEREGRGDPDQVTSAEGQKLLKGVPSQDPVWALSREGSAWSSAEWARRIEQLSMTAHPNVHVMIGGAWGLSPEVLDRAQHVVSLAAGTLPHELARLILFEQLYRAGTILRGEPYHKGPRP